MDDKTRGVGHDEFEGRSDESTRNYAAGPARTAARPADAAGPRPARGARPDDLDPETERRTRQLEGEIEHTRAELSETIDALQEKLRPGNLVSEATDRMKTATTEKVKDMADTASETAQGMWEGARQNPVPALMIGAGVAWMLLDRSRHGNGHSSRRAWADSPSRRYGTFNEPDDYYRDDVRGASREWSGQRSTGEGLTTWAREAGDEARHTARKAQNGLQRMLRQNPLLVGAAAMLAGAAVGASLPETERENELMGEARDTVVDRAQQAAENAVTAVKEAANDVVGDTVGKVAEKVTSKQS